MSIEEVEAKIRAAVAEAKAEGWVRRFMAWRNRVRPPRSQASRSGGPMTAPFVVGSDTSKAAAKSIEPHAPRIQDRVLVAVRNRGSLGITCDEVEVSLGLSHQTVSARIRDLVKANAIVDSGERRKTRSGRKAVVYVPKA